MIRPVINTSIEGRLDRHRRGRPVAAGCI